MTLAGQALHSHATHKATWRGVYDAFVKREKFRPQLSVIPLAGLCVASPRQTGNFAGG